MKPDPSEDAQRRGPLLGHFDPYIVAISFPLALLWTSLIGAKMSAASFSWWEAGIQRLIDVCEFNLTFLSYYAPLGMLALAAVAANQIIGGSPRTRRTMAVAYAAPCAVLVGAVFGAQAIMPF